MSERKQSKMLDLTNCVYCVGCECEDEIVALTNSNLQNISGSSHDDLQFKLTEFVIHSTSVLCSLEDCDIENGNQVFVCGLLCNAFVDDTVCTTIPVKKIGPLDEWWFYGFDGGSQMEICVESPYSTYLLKEPHLVYKKFFDNLHLKMFFTKFSIEIIKDNFFCDFDEFMYLLREKFENFDKEFFLNSIDFIVKQVKSYDEFCEENEIQIAQSAVFEMLAKLSNAYVIMNRPNNHLKLMTNCFQRSNSKNCNTLISESIFDVIFKEIIENKKKLKVETIQTKLTYQDIYCGCFIYFNQNRKFFYGRIVCLNQTDNQIHVNIFCSGKETFLSESSPKNFLFATKRCLDIRLENIHCCIDVILSYRENYLSRKEFVCFLLYHDQTCSFESLPPKYLNSENLMCFGCVSGNDIDTKPAIQNGDCVLFKSELQLPLFNYFQYDNTDTELFDERLYPEKYRKAFTNQLKDNFQFEDLNNCFIVGYVKNIIRKNDSTFFEINIFYRPQNVFEDYQDFIKSDLNVLFWTEICVTVNIRDIVKKCQVIYSQKPISLGIYQKEPVFYFNLSFDVSSKIFFELPDSLKSMFNTVPNLENGSDKKLNILDLFSGCGGLSYGFKLLTSKLYSIDNDKAASETYKLNYPSAKVLNSDANLILDLLINCDDSFIKNELPSKGQIDLIIGGPPCQGFSEMNRFSKNGYSLFKSSLVACFLNYIEYFRPKYFLFENVRNLVYYQNSLILKIICSFFVQLGYQLKVAILQAGCYGVPQNRKRLFIIGSRFDSTIPSFPLPTHMFSLKQSDTSFKIDDNVFIPVNFKYTIYRMITVEDAIGDLYALSEDYFVEKDKPYRNKNELSHYQRILKTGIDDLVSDHYCKRLSALNQERIKRIPFKVGSDWRDLPNICLTLPGGTIVPKLVYAYKDKKNGNSINCYPRGVCSCAQLESCDLNKCRQENTLIPWCLVHTANRQNHWSGLYGRLSHKGFFPTIVTNPDPISIQGKVLHPNEDRVISVREAARAQSFPDHFKFCGKINEKYRQIGNAVPPQLSMAIANEFATCI